MLQVFKFGGTCTDSKEKINRIIELTQNELDAGDKVIITCSAKSGVTDKLLSFMDGNFDEKQIKYFLDDLLEEHLQLLTEPYIKDRYESILSEVLRRLERILYGINYFSISNPRNIDMVSTFGERLIVYILQAYFEKNSIESKIIFPEDFITTDGVFSDAKVMLELTKLKAVNNLIKNIQEFKVIIVPGFYGVSNQLSEFNEAIITTLGRSGTDYTAAVLANITNANILTIWKDVYGFMTGDPNIIENPKLIEKLTYREVEELSFFGATLLHKRAIEPLRNAHIELRIRHLFDSENYTTVYAEIPDERINQVKSISNMTDLCALRVKINNSGNAYNIITLLITAFPKLQVLYSMTSQTNSIIIFNQKDTLEVEEIIKSLSHQIIEFEIIKNVSILCLIGNLSDINQIESTINVIFSDLNVNLIMTSIGTSKSSIYYIIKSNQLRKVMNKIHEFLIIHQR